jgi:hypothetical protein
MIGASNDRLDEILGQSPLSGWVYIVDGKEDAGQFLGGQEQK